VCVFDSDCYHGKDGRHWYKDVFAVDVADFNRAALQQRAVVVGVAGAGEETKMGVGRRGEDGEREGGREGRRKGVERYE
jgi:hypothetical protein